MTSPRNGFRRARATSWTLVGVGTTGVVVASLLAYADTAEKQSGQRYDAAEDPPAALPVTAPLATRQYTTTTSVAPSYSPQIHTRSHGS